MREIKFRIWWPGAAAFTGKPTDPMIGPMTLKELMLSGTDEWPEDAVLMQYTGLKDKNGVEIYEGDVVVAPDYDPEPMEVAYEDGCFVPVGLSDFPPAHMKAVEVIGNIYESPELLG